MFINYVELQGLSEARFAKQVARGENLRWVPPRCLPDATKMVPDVSRCLSDASSGDGEGDDDGDGGGNGDGDGDDGDGDGDDDDGGDDDDDDLDDDSPMMPPE